VGAGVGTGLASLPPQAHKTSAIKAALHPKKRISLTILPQKQGGLPHLI